MYHEREIKKKKSTAKYVHMTRMNSEKLCSDQSHAFGSNFSLARHNFENPRRTARSIPDRTSAQRDLIRPEKCVLNPITIFFSDSLVRFLVDLGSIWTLCV